MQLVIKCIYAYVDSGLCDKVSDLVYGFKFYIMFRHPFCYFLKKFQYILSRQSLILLANGVLHVSDFCVF
jgi:hypothetical protein